jgi:hypothetical protein
MTQVGAPAPAAHAASSGEGFADLTPAVHKVHQAEHCCSCAYLPGVSVDDNHVAHHSQAGGFATRVEFDAQGLQLTGLR